MRFTGLFLVIFFALSSSAYGQRDSVYVRSYYDKLIVSLFLGAPQNELEFEPKKAPDSLSSTYTPNTYGIIGLRLGYKRFFLSLSTRTGDLQDQYKYGKTKYTSLFAGLNLDKILVEAFYRNYKGYADLNTRSYLKTPDSLPYIIRNDLHTRQFKLKAIHQVSKKKFSYPAAFVFTERQMKSAVALFFMGTFNRSVMDGDSSFFSYVTRPAYKNSGTLTDLKITSLGGAVGGAFNLVFRQLFFSGIVFVGLDYQYQKYFISSTQNWNSRLTVAGLADSRFSLGINGNRAFAAITVKNDINNINLPDLTCKNTYTIVTFDFGYRFNAPHIVEKGYSRIHQLVHSIF